jgi:uncharacterized membrane protein
VRGIAVLVMLEAHVLDSWTRPVDRSSIAFRNLTILGGFGAPLFLWLAGVALVLAAEASLGRGQGRGVAARQVCSRGLQIFALAFLFRLQALIVTPGGSLLQLLRVDVLNVMGPAMVAAGIVWGAVRRRAAMVAVCGAVAAAIAMATPAIRTAAFIDAVPVPLRWYLRPSGANTMFTLFPWAGFVFAGAAAGGLLAAARAPRHERRLLAGFAIAGTALAAMGLYAATLPSLYRESYFWTSSPAYFAVRLGVLMGVLAAAYGVYEAVGSDAAVLRVLQRFGRSSLFVYWIHVEIVYGYASRPLHRSLSIPQAAAGFVLFTGAMYVVVLAKDHGAKIWRSRSRVSGLTRRPQSDAHAPGGTGH